MSINLQLLQKAVFTYLNMPEHALGIPFYTSIPSVIQYPYGRLEIIPALLDIHKYGVWTAKLNLSIFIKTNNNLTIHNTLTRIVEITGLAYIKENIDAEADIQNFQLVVSNPRVFPDIVTGVQHLMFEFDCFYNS